MQHLSWVEVSRSALQHNVKVFKKIIGNRDLFCVVKSNAYGHGMVEVLRVLRSDASVSGFMVASLDESLMLTKLTRKRIIVLSMWQRDQAQLKLAIRAGVELPIFDVRSAKYLNALSKRMKRKIQVHIKLDVGTARLGFEHDEIDQIVQVLQMEHLNVVGIFGHFADSENVNERYTKTQHKRFMACLDAIRKKGFSAPPAHIACSASALRGSSYLHEGVRLGIALYGLWPSKDSKKFYRTHIQLRPVLTWKTTILQIKEHKAGDPIGYGMSYRVQKKTRIATVAIGYADGYDRKLSNAASILIAGRRCRVRGRICMNLTMAELPHQVHARSGDEAVLIGKQGSERITAEELAKHAGTINYEIVTRINPLLPRRISS